MCNKPLDKDHLNMLYLYVYMMDSITTIFLSIDEVFGGALPDYEVDKVSFDVLG